MLLLGILLVVIAAAVPVVTLVAAFLGLGSIAALGKMISTIVSPLLLIGGIVLIVFGARRNSESRRA